MLNVCYLGLPPKHGLLAIQNAANNEHDEDDPATRGIRAKYSLDLFPPTTPETKDPAPTPTPPAP